MAKEYKVWVTVEVHDDDAVDRTEEYMDLDLEFAATATFKDEDVAISFANLLNDVGATLHQGLETDPDEDDENEEDPCDPLLV